MHYIPGLRLRVSEEVEEVGIDESDMGEFAYDYVGSELPLSTGYRGSRESDNQYLKERQSSHVH